MAELKPLDRPPPLAERVYATLREHLRAGRIDRDGPLTEAALAGELGVSRTPVREALARLASEGLVAAHGRSYSVPTLDGRDIDELYALRRILETEGAREAARARAADPAALRNAVAASVRAHRAGDVAAFIAANGAFRAAWLARVGNRRLVQAIELYSDHVQSLRPLTLADPGVRATVIEGLQAIAAAVLAGDASGAARAMRAHLQNAERALRAALGRPPAGRRRSASQ